MTEVFNIGVPGLGVTLGYATSSGGSFTLVGQLKGVDPNDAEMGEWESTGLTSAAKEFLPTILEAGEVGGHVIWNPHDTTHEALFAALLAGTIYYWKIVYPAAVGPGASGETAANETFQGFLKKFAPAAAEVESYMEAEFSIRITGLPAIA